MFSDVDESLRELLTADMPIQGGEVDISFERPTREWANRLTKPALSLFLSDIRERIDHRDEAPYANYNANGTVTRRRPPRRIDLCYLVTAWAKEPLDEHRILARAMGTLYRHAEVPEEHLQGGLKFSDYRTLLRVMPPDHLAKPADLWGVLDNELHASMTWVATAPLDVYVPVTGPIVQTREIAIGAVGEEWRETFIQVAGTVRGHDETGVDGARVSVGGTAISVLTNKEGQFVIPRIASGEYTWRVESPGGEPIETVVTVPSESYDVRI